MLSLSLFSTKLSLCCNLFCFGVRSGCIFVSLRNFWTTSINFTFFLSILFDNPTSASYTEFFLFDIFQLSFSHHTLCSSFEDSPWQAWLLCTRQKDMDRCNGISTAAPQARFENGSSGFHWRGFLSHSDHEDESDLKHMWDPQPCETPIPLILFLRESPNFSNTHTLVFILYTRDIHKNMK